MTYAEREKDKDQADFIFGLIVAVGILVLVIISGLSYIRGPKIELIKVLEYKVGRCIVPPNSTGPFLITKVEGTEVCVKNKNSIDYNPLIKHNINNNTESCMPTFFWDSMIIKSNWTVEGFCNEYRTE